MSRGLLIWITDSAGPGSDDAAGGQPARFNREFAMKANVGNVDRAIRIVLGLALLSLLLVLEGNARLVGLVGLVPLFTAAVRFCPLYAVLGFDTCPKATGGA